LTINKPALLTIEEPGDIILSSLVYALSSNTGWL